MVGGRSCQIMRQKASTVLGSGPTERGGGDQGDENQAEGREERDEIIYFM